MRRIVRVDGVDYFYTSDPIEVEQNTDFRVSIRVYNNGSLNPDGSPSQKYDTWKQ